MVCVDAGSPRRIRCYFERMAQEHDLTLLRADRLMTPNEARNAVLHFVDTEFVAFVDYDTDPRPGWLERLEECARSTSASLVAPVFLERDGRRVRPHMAGGSNHFVDVDGRRWLDEKSWRDPPVSTGAAYPTENVDFHCVLVRRQVFEAHGQLDEELASLRDHCDLCLAVRRDGGSVYVEPRAQVTYTRLRRFRRADRWFWLVRWSDAWNAASLQRFEAKWHVSKDDPSSQDNVVWGRSHRLYCYRPWISITDRLSKRLTTAVVDRIDPRLQRSALARASTVAARSGAPRLVHRARWLGEGWPPSNGPDQVLVLRQDDNRREPQDARRDL